MPKTSASQDDVNEVLGMAGPIRQPLVQALRQQLLKMSPRATLLAWPQQRVLSFGVGPRKRSEHDADIAVHPAHINLGLYRGSTLADPSGLLEGSGQKLRHIKLTSRHEASAKPVLALLKPALAERAGAVQASG